MDEVVRVDLIDLDGHLVHVDCGEAEVEVATPAEVKPVADEIQLRRDVLLAEGDGAGEIASELRAVDGH